LSISKNIKQSFNEEVIGSLKSKTASLLAKKTMEKKKDNKNKVKNEILDCKVNKDNKESKIKGNIIYSLFDSSLKEKQLENQQSKEILRINNEKEENENRSISNINTNKNNISTTNRTIQ
jgi:hypothetical protein